MKLPAFLKNALSGSAPEGALDDVAGFVVQDRESGRTVHSEYFESGRYSDAYVADKIVRHRERLERKYAPSRYEVEAGLFSSKEAFFHFFPEAKK